MFRTDVAIVGGGIAGTLAALTLPSHVGAILIDERHELCAGATSRAFGNISLGYGSGAVAEATSRSLPFYSSAVLRPAGESSLIHRRGEILVIPNDLELDKSKLVGEEVSPTEAARMSPFVASQKIRAASYLDESYDIDPAKLIRSIRTVLNRRGNVRQQLGSQLRSLRRDSCGWTITLDDDTIHAAAVVNCCGSKSDLVAHLADARTMGLSSLKRSVAAFEMPLSDDERESPLVASVDDRPTFRPTADGVIVSPGEVEPHDESDPVALPVDVDDARSAFARVSERQLEKVARHWACIRTFSPDGQPCVGRGEGSFYWFAGLGGYGLQAGPALAEVLVSAVLSVPSAYPELAAAVDPARFA